MSLKDLAVPFSNVPPPAQRSYTQIVITELLTLDPGTGVSLTRLLVYLADTYGDSPSQWRPRVKHVFDTGAHRATALKGFMMLSVKGVSTILRGVTTCPTHPAQKLTRLTATFH